MTTHLKYSKDNQMTTGSWLGVILFEYRSAQVLCRENRIDDIDAHEVPWRRFAQSRAQTWSASPAKR